MDGIESLGAQLSEAEIQSWLGACFPGHKVILRSRQRLSSFQHLIERIQLNLTDSENKTLEQEVYLRIYAGEFSWWTMTADIERRERAAYDFVASIPLLIPRFLMRHSRPPFWFSLSKKVEGEPIAAHCTIESLDKLAGVLHRLHSADLAKVNRSEIPDVSLKALFAKFRIFAAEIQDPEIDRLVHKTEDGLRDVKETFSFLHGDCQQGNFLVGPAGLTLMDLEESCLGDPRIDLASLFFQLGKMVSENAAENFLQAYQKRIDWKIGSLRPWKNLLILRDILTARCLESRKAQGQKIRFESADLWIRHGQKLFGEIKSVNLDS